MYEMKATAYCCGTRTASGKRVREGLCASKPEWIGKTAAIYRKDKHGCIGDFLGYYEIEDTGGKSIRSGKVIDIYFDTLAECKKFGVKDVYVKVIDADG